MTVDMETLRAIRPDIGAIALGPSLESLVFDYFRDFSSPEDAQRYTNDFFMELAKRAKMPYRAK